MSREADTLRDQLKDMSLFVTYLKNLLGVSTDVEAVEAIKTLTEQEARHVGATLIAQERQRQISSEGYDPEHDDRHTSGELNDAAICYASAAAKQARGESIEYLRDVVPAGFTGFPWPWEDEWWKPSEDQSRNLVKAGALIAAEIDRLQRYNVKRRPAEVLS